jgi:hypothetical protein
MYLSDNLSTVEIYDPGTDTWATGSDLYSAKAYFGFVGTGAGRLYAVGGSFGAGSVLVEGTPLYRRVYIPLVSR